MSNIKKSFDLTKRKNRIHIFQLQGICSNQPANRKLLLFVLFSLQSVGFFFGNCPRGIGTTAKFIQKLTLQIESRPGTSREDPRIQGSN